MDPCDSWAQNYDSIYSYVREDIPFYVGEARRAGGPVLELGCGTGRVTVPIAEAGVEIVGLDSSEAMLEVASRKLERLSLESAATLTKGDMARLPAEYDGRFSLVIVPFRGFLSPADGAGAGGDALRSQAEPGARRPARLQRLRSRAADARGGRRHRAPSSDVTDPETGNRLVVWHQSSYDNYNQVIFVRLTVDRLDDRGRVVERVYLDYELRYVHRWEMHHLLVRCGFEVLDLFGDFDGSEFDEMSGEMVWVAGPASPRQA